MKSLILDTFYLFVRIVLPFLLKIISFLFLIILISSVYGASSGTLTLQGTVASINDVTIVPSGSNNLNLDITNGEIGKLIATITETSNNFSGYNISISSVNASELRNNADPSKKTTYTLKYDTGPYQSITSTPIQVKNIGGLETLTTNYSEIRVSVVAYTLAPSGIYTDTLTISIIAN